MKKMFFLQFGIIIIEDGKIHFYWFDFRSATVDENMRILESEKYPS